MSDAILYWNGIALEANRISHTNGADEETGPTLSSRALAIVHLAMYDAYIGVAKAAGGMTDGHYLAAVDLPDPPVATASPDAAIAAAAYTTLYELFPSQRPFFDLVYDPDYVPIGVDPAAAQAGHAYGADVAEKLLTKREKDPGKSDVDYEYETASGKHRPDPDNPKQGFHAPYYGAGSNLFATTKRYEIVAPPDVDETAGEYRRALRQVRGKGIIPELLETISPAGRRRTPEETLIGIYWGYDGAPGLGTPPRFYNQILRQMAVAKTNTVDQNARLFALANAAMADAGILSWEQKYHHDFWRPVLGIREHGDPLGPEEIPGDDIGEDADPAWLPLGAPFTNTLFKNFTPPFPAYPSGHATFGAAVFQIARRFYDIGADENGPDTCLQDGAGKDMAFVSEEYNGLNKDNKGTVRPLHARTFPDGLWDMILENGLSRVFLGVHWVFDAYALDDAREPDLGRDVDLDAGIAGLGGVPLGLAIANDIFDDGMIAANAAPKKPEMAGVALAESVGTEAAINLSRIAPAKPWPLG